MRLPVLAWILSAALVASRPATSQSQTYFEIYPHPMANSYFYAWISPARATEVLQEASGQVFAGIGDDGVNCVVHGFQFRTRDEEASTQEPYDVVFRRQDPARPGPDVGPGGTITRVTGLMTPPGSGRQAWQITIGFQTPLNVPCTGGLFYGVQIADIRLGSPPDGQSVQGVSYDTSSSLRLGDNPRLGTPKHGWSHYSGGTPMADPTTYRMGVLLEQAALNAGGIDPANTRQPPGTSNYGLGGFYPDVSANPRHDGLDFRVRDAAKPGGLALLVLSGGLGAPGGATIGSVTGRFRLGSGLLLLGVGQLASGEAVIPVAPPGVIPQDVINQVLYFQALTVDSNFSVFHLSNAAGVSF